VLAPESGLRAAVCLRGRATGSRELDVLDPRHLVERIDAILFTGGSALGLGAADGVMRWLRERGRGLPVGDKGTIPIVPSAVIFDLGNVGKPLGWPSPDDAYRACDNATADFAEGRVGVGRGATCGKAAGIENMIPAGLGSWAAQFGDVIVSALVVVNAVGDIRNARGEIIAGRVDDIRRKWVPDARLGVFEVSLLPKGIAGISSSRDARDALRRLANEQELVDKVQLIPDAVGDPAAIVTAALAPLQSEPKISAARVSEVLHGEVLDVLERREEWLRIRAPDGYIAWLPAGYVATG